MISNCTISIYVIDHNVWMFFFFQVTYFCIVSYLINWVIPTFVWFLFIRVTYLWMFLLFELPTFAVVPAPRLNPVSTIISNLCLSVRELSFRYRIPPFLASCWSILRQTTPIRKAYTTSALTNRVTQTWFLLALQVFRWAIFEFCAFICHKRFNLGGVERQV